MTTPTTYTRHLPTCDAMTFTVFEQMVWYRVTVTRTVSHTVVVCAIRANGHTYKLMVSHALYIAADTRAYVNIGVRLYTTREQTSSMASDTARHCSKNIVPVLALCRRNTKIDVRLPVMPTRHRQPMIAVRTTRSNSRQRSSIASAEDIDCDTDSEQHPLSVMCASAAFYR